MTDATDATDAAGVTGSVMPATVRAAQLVVHAFAFTGLVVVLTLSETLNSRGLGQLMAPWLLVWVCALLALTYDGSARHGVRLATCLLLGFVVAGSLGAIGGTEEPAEFLDAALRTLFGLPAIVLLSLPESTDWFRRAR
ncbi:hypothetical protein ACIO93_40795 [Streptomyces sp. NPDC087903]|uniref:hypothetical protein n=1 Tax=Streptomyces sp. NPDC087903 TaxID=3365819 RepID=UPI003810D7F1